MIARIYRFFGRIRIAFNTLGVKARLRLYGAEFSDLRAVGRPRITVRGGGRLTIGPGFRMNSRFYGNSLSVTPCAIHVGEGATLSIGRNVGISSCFITAAESVTIEDNVKIGGGCYIMDTDFHSLDPAARLDRTTDRPLTAPVVIRENAFIGAASIILKGVTIGRNSVVGAGSVVCRDIPDNELWAGNPARFIRTLTD